MRSNTLWDQQVTRSNRISFSKRRPSICLSLSLSHSLHPRDSRMISEPFVMIAVDSPRERKKEKSQGRPTDCARRSRLVRHYVRAKTARHTNTVDTAAWSRAEENLARGTTLAANLSNSSLERSRRRCIRRRRWRPKVVPLEAGVPPPDVVLPILAL